MLFIALIIKIKKRFTAANSKERIDTMDKNLLPSFFDLLDEASYDADQAAEWEADDLDGEEEEAGYFEAMDNRLASSKELIKYVLEHSEELINQLEASLPTVLEEDEDADELEEAEEIIDDLDGE